MEQTIQRLEFLCDTIPSLLHRLDEITISFKPSPNKWSKKEIIGHLIDSATNNHQRFIRGQFEDLPRIAYNQDSWNTYSYHQLIKTHQLITFWETYNRQLLAIIKHIPEERLSRQVHTGQKTHSLKFLINDYMEHLEHHLKQLVSY
ncbi:DinB family protein [Olivibacter domesticus]|uniref:DinB superfamily protein n=1 Tax=Olivibacter domesticus TaxID=407022 RepID=A0A1H7LUM7_OLID1|nr:DinB family protein [Olivibacter domesticus]SEL02661.1 DinB superfamily protein [Olivibacter domesticus]